MSDAATLQPQLAKLIAGERLTLPEAKQAFMLMMCGAVSEAQTAAFLTALRLRGETVEVITAGAQVLRAQATPVVAPPGTLDTCGTGGDGAGTFNISTAVALVVAACGVTVAKHGNRAASSKSGTADVLQRLGVKIDLTPDAAQRCLDKAGIAFLFAPTFHAAMKHVGPIRRELGFPTVFNLLGPLANPASTKRQLIGVFAKQWVQPFADVLTRLGSERAWVVHGTDGLDEITTTSESFVAELRDGAVRTFTVAPEDAGLARATPSSLRGGDPETNAAALQGLLRGEKSPYRDIVVLNSAAALIVADKAGDLKSGAAQAIDAIDSGRASRVLEKLIEASNA